MIITDLLVLPWLICTGDVMFVHPFLQLWHLVHIHKHCIIMYYTLCMHMWHHICALILHHAKLAFITILLNTNSCIEPWVKDELTWFIHIMSISCIADRDSCFVVKMIFGWESKVLTDSCFKTVLILCSSYQKVDFQICCFDQQSSFRISSPQDLEDTRYGRWVQSKECFCHCCSCQSLHCADYRTGNNQCTWCQQRKQEHCI